MTNDGEALACTCAHLADERKAEQILVLHVGPLTFLADYFVIATGRSERQIRAIAGQLQSRMKQLRRDIVGVEGEPESGWVLIDLGDAVVHLFSGEARRLYDLEMLWGEASRIDWQRVSPLAGPASDERAG